LSLQEEIAIEARCVEEVEVGRMAGPFTRPPFPNSWCGQQPRIVPIGKVPKFKWVPDSPQFRMISHLSVHEPSSLNDLTYSPLFLSFHQQPSHIRDEMALLGPGAQVDTTDAVKAFRINRTPDCDLHLFVFKVNGVFFVDVYHCFGARGSEWAFNAEGSVITWAAWEMGVGAPDSFLNRYVDNFTLMSSRSDASHQPRMRRLEDLLRSTGLVLHDEQSSADGPVMLSGFRWRPDTGTVECPVDKYRVMVTRVGEWRSRAMARGRFSSEEIMSIAGLIGWASTICAVLHFMVGSLRRVANRRVDNPSLPSLVLSPECVASVVALDDYLRGWDRSGRIFLGFSAVSTWEVLVRSDASTDFGAGAFCLPARVSFSHRWTPRERKLAFRSDRESTTLFELLTILLSIRTFIDHLRGMRVQFECDSEPAVRILSKAYSEEPGCQLVVGEIVALCMQLHIVPRWEHILSTLNPLADALSHNDLSQAQRIAVSEAGGSLRMVCYRS